MKSRIELVTVQGKEYKVWSDYIKRGTFAEDENGTVKCIKGSGYLSNELSIRKAIACCFGLSSFRKKKRKSNQKENNIYKENKDV